MEPKVTKWRISFPLPTGVATTITLYQSISDGEATSIKNAKTFKLDGGVEGKYFWERLGDALRFGQQMGQTQIVRVRYEKKAAALFDRWTVLDGIGPARFANEEQMNDGLLELTLQ